MDVNYENIDKFTGTISKKFLPPDKSIQFRDFLLFASYKNLLQIGYIFRSPFSFHFHETI